jgi:hypothetical protein
MTPTDPTDSKETPIVNEDTEPTTPPKPLPAGTVRLATGGKQRTAYVEIGIWRDEGEAIHGTLSRAGTAWGAHWNIPKDSRMYKVMREILEHPDVDRWEK